MDKAIQIDTFNRFVRVSRETIISLKKYEDMLIEANKSLNLVGNSTIKQVWTRHFLDSAQVIDFIDKNDKIILDLGSGAGFPGLVIAILAKDRKIPLNVKLIEKSSKKIKFLNEIINKLKLNAEALDQDILSRQIKFSNDLFVSRAFKPLNITLELIHNKAQNWKKIFIFLGKTGEQQLILASNNWDIKYKQRMSITNKDSKIIEINKLIKK